MSRTSGIHRAPGSALSYRDRSLLYILFWISEVGIAVDMAEETKNTVDIIDKYIKIPSLVSALSLFPGTTVIAAIAILTGALQECSYSGFKALF